jgi:hypothetical protein
VEKGGKGGVIVILSRGFDLWHRRSGGTNIWSLSIYVYSSAANEAAPAPLGQRCHVSLRRIVVQQRFRVRTVAVIIFLVDDFI